MLTAVPLLLTFLTFVYASLVNIKEFDATVIQVRGLASYKSWFNPPYIRK